MILLNEIRILQLGNEDWNKVYVLPEVVRLDYVDKFFEVPKEPYDIFFLDRTPLENELEPLYQAIKAYTLFVTENVEIHDKVQWLCRSRKAQYIKRVDVQKFLQQEAKYYYAAPYGEKFKFHYMSISRNFQGTVKWNGNYSVVLQGEFGNDFSQIAFWRNNILVSKGRTIDLWLEYYKSSDIELSLMVTMFSDGSVSNISKQWRFSEAELEQVVQIESEQKNGWIFVSLHARGEGELKIVALHNRYSRGKHGYFLPGGERYVDSNREEIFCYFEPGDMKPPLNVYFSGYKTRQGFEGYYMMKKLGCPFLLLAEPRLEGGAFYMGSDEYENMLVDIIRKYVTELGFESSQVILSGLSMGTYGALYYGCDIRPYAILLGKPLTSIGNIAANEKYLRPGGFPTSLDVLKYQNGGADDNMVRKLNNRFWDKFDMSDWRGVKFIVSYMIEDDYDCDAYNMLLSHLSAEGVQVYGKGIHGRHNDNTPMVTKWFINQYKRILREEFGRRIGIE